MGIDQRVMLYKSSLLRTCFGVSSNYPAKGSILISRLIVSHPLSPSLLCLANLLLCVCVWHLYIPGFSSSVLPLFLSENISGLTGIREGEDKGLKFFVLIVFQMY